MGFYVFYSLAVFAGFCALLYLSRYDEMRMSKITSAPDGTRRDMLASAVLWLAVSVACFSVAYGLTDW